nr:ATP-binding cassette domain-containing protein [Corallococcus macrosporus]
MVVQDVSVTIEQGQFVAIVGASGAGKSSLAHLLLGLYLPSSGSIRFDGVPLAERDLKEVRRQMGVVLQNPSLFRGDIRRNIAYEDPLLPLAAETRVEEQARDGFASEFKAGKVLETQLSARLLTKRRTLEALLDARPAPRARVAPEAWCSSSAASGSLRAVSSNPPSATATHHPCGRAGHDSDAPARQPHAARRRAGLRTRTVRLPRAAVPLASGLG